MPMITITIMISISVNRVKILQVFINCCHIENSEFTRNLNDKELPSHQYPRLLTCEHGNRKQACCEGRNPGRTESCCRSPEPVEVTVRSAISDNSFKFHYNAAHKATIHFAGEALLWTYTFHMRPHTPDTKSKQIYNKSIYYKININRPIPSKA
jgi:hypothetical protein